MAMNTSLHVLRPRRAALRSSWARPLVALLLVSLGLPLASIHAMGPAEAQPKTKESTEIDGGGNVVVSDNRDGSAASSLSGASLQGVVHVYSTPSGRPTTVRYYLNDPGMTQRPTGTETSRPYGLFGGVVGAINPWDTATVPAGTHTLTAEFIYNNGRAIIQHAVFRVLAPTSEPSPTPSPSPSPSPSPEPEPAPAVDRLGLHVTAEELKVWEQRWSNGTTDSFLNARLDEEKARVTSNRNTFVASPNDQMWRVDGIVPFYSDGCRAPATSSRDFGPERVKAATVRDAAFHALLHRDRAVLQQVGSVLVAQAKRADVNFANAAEWCPMTKGMKDAAAPGFVISHLMTTHLHAYDYYRAAVSMGLVGDLSLDDRSTIRRWHLAFAGYIEPSNTWRANLPFVDRLAGNYSLTASYADPNNLWNDPRTFVGGPKVHRGHNLFNNRDASLTRFIALAGITYDHAAYKDRAHRWIRDWNRYHLLPHGATGDMHRGSSSASTGTAYMALGASHVLTAIDAFARIGDTTLYDHGPTDGLHDSDGAPLHGDTRGKNFLFFVQTLARYGNGTHDRTNEAGQPFDLRTPSNLGLHDRLIQANIYYRDAGLSRDFYRGANGQPAWVRPPSKTDLNDAWAFPAPYLMWAGLENQIWPYPNT